MKGTWSGKSEVGAIQTVCMHDWEEWVNLYLCCSSWKIALFASYFARELGVEWVELKWIEMTCCQRLHEVDGSLIGAARSREPLYSVLVRYRRRSSRPVSFVSSDLCSERQRENVEWHLAEGTASARERWSGWNSGGSQLVFLFSPPTHTNKCITFPFVCCFLASLCS